MRALHALIFKSFAYPNTGMDNVFSSYNVLFFEHYHCLLNFYMHVYYV